MSDSGKLTVGMIKQLNDTPAKFSPNPDQTLVTACNCVGPQNDQPLCPCKMRRVIVRNGRYIQPEVDLGPVSGTDSTYGDGR